jgi:hypothetical protein
VELEMMNGMPLTSVELMENASALADGHNNISIRNIIIFLIVFASA